jgi:hypothetical protein
VDALIRLLEGATGLTRNDIADVIAAIALGIPALWVALMDRRLRRRR